MSAAGPPANATPLQSLVADYLRMLTHERGASAHTLRAYRRELEGFAAWMNKSWGN